jgi:hypothetical protein
MCDILLAALFAHHRTFCTVSSRTALPPHVPCDLKLALKDEVIHVLQQTIGIAFDF